MPHLNERPRVAASSLVGAVRRHIGSDPSRADVAKIASTAVDSRRVSTIKAQQSATKIAEWFDVHYRRCLAKQAGLHETIRVGLSDLAQYAADHAMAGRDLVELKKFACSYDPKAGRVWDALFDAVHEKLAERGIRSGRADQEPAPLAKRTPLPRANEITYQVVNGANKLQVFLDTLKEKISQEDQIAQHLRLMDTHGPAVVAGITSLRTTEDVEKYLADDLAKHASTAADATIFFRDLEKIARIMGALGGLGAEAARGAGKAVKHTWKPALRYGVPMTALAIAGNAVGHGISKNTRDYRPGAYRGVNEGGSLE